MGTKRIINVNGPYIAEQHIDTQILHAEHVYMNTPDKQTPRVAEDVAYEDLNTHFCFITDKCIKNGMAERVESYLSTACKGSAEALWKCIHEYEFMGYLCTQNMDATKIYNALTEHFGTLSFDIPNFRKYRNR